MKKIAICLLLIFAALGVRAQTTEFTYQGSLKNAGAPASGNYDFEFALFDAASGGAQVGSTITLINVAVANGIFGVRLDFGNQFAAGASRYLEIRVRPAGGGAYTALAPRQPVNSAPFSIKSLTADTATNATNAATATNATTAATATNALQLGGITAGQYVLTTDSRMTDARNPLPNSANYIQNSTAQQTASNFNVSGTGSADIINARTQYNLGGIRILSIRGTQNIFAGERAGESTSGNGNSFFGYVAGIDNTTGIQNSFFGLGAGSSNTTGGAISAFGLRAGATSTSGARNSFFGAVADGANGLANATAIGYAAFVTQSNSLVLGGINGINGATDDTNVGIGTTAPADRLHISVNGGDILFGGGGCPAGSTAIGFNSPMTGCTNYALRGDGNNILLLNRPTGGSIFFREGNGASQVVINPGGTLRLNFLGAAGATALCRNANNEVSTCSSSIRYKENVEPFAPGLDLIKRLRPVSFTWKAGGQRDFGLVAEEVAAAEPLLTTNNEKGETEGVKYDRVAIVAVNAIQEQQRQIEAQQKQIDAQKQIIERQQTELDALKKFVCAQNPAAGFCGRPEK